MENTATAIREKIADLAEHYDDSDLAEAIAQEIDIDTLITAISKYNCIRGVVNSIIDAIEIKLNTLEKIKSIIGD